MFKKQYRVYPEYIHHDGDMKYVAQYRYFPFWWMDIGDYTFNEISAWNREDAIQKLNKQLELNIKLETAQKEAKPL